MPRLLSPAQRARNAAALRGRRNVPTTHEGADAPSLTPEQTLRRTVLSCLLGENEFYEDGVAIADRIKALCEQINPAFIGLLAIEARSRFNLRSVPLLLLCALEKRARGTTLAGMIGDTITATIQRPDELYKLLLKVAEFYGYEPDKMKKHVGAQMKKGIAAAFAKFSAHQMGKYKGEDEKITLRDAMFLTHPKRSEITDALAKKELATPDTWETQLSAGADKRETFTRLIVEEKIGYLALLRNLRNMHEAGVDPALVSGAIIARRGAQRVLPFRYLAASRACPFYTPSLDQALRACVAELPVFPGTTVVMVDLSVSMRVRLSARSDLSRMDAACALAAVINGDVEVYSFSNQLVKVKGGAGLKNVADILASQEHRGTKMGKALTEVNANIPHDRLIIISDEQSEDAVPDPVCLKAYMINVASAQNGVAYGPKWVNITGFSERVLHYIGELEGFAHVDAGSEVEAVDVA